MGPASRPATTAGTYIGDRCVSSKLSAVLTSTTAKPTSYTPPSAARPERAEYEGSQGDSGTDVGKQPVTGHSPVPSTEPPAADGRFPAGLRGTDQQQAWDQGHPGEPVQTRTRERDDRECPGGEGGG